MSDHIAGCVCCAAGGDMSQVDAHMAKVIGRCGWAVVGVPLPRGRGYLAYSVGLGMQGHPELYLEGPLVGLLARRVNELALAQTTAQAPWQAGDVIDLECAPYRVVPITREKMPMVTRFYGRPMPAWRLDYLV